MTLQWSRRKCTKLLPRFNVIISPEGLAVFFVFIIIFGLRYPINVQGFPTVNDHNLHIDVITRGLKFPTAMDFLGPDDILVLEKDNGTVRRVLSGQLLTQPVLDISVANKFDRGMLGIAVSRIQGEGAGNKNMYVFVYLTESRKEGSDHCSSWRSCLKGGEPDGNRLYRYRWDGQKLIEPKLLLDLPAVPGPAHNGGSLLLGPDDNVYLVTGDLRFPNKSSQNIKDGLPADGTSGILRITQDGNPVGKGILGKEYPLNLYYAYGIRNSFGMDFDPVTGNLWDTENGPAYGDEINLVKPGFNSGWAKVQGIWKPFYDQERAGDFIAGQVITNISTDDLVNFDGNGKYSAPEFIWKQSTGPTALTFLDSNKLGKEYENDIFVGSVGSGQIYHFDLNKDRTELVLPAKLQDKIADNNQEIDQSEILFGRGFGGITDIEVGPYDGYLYIVSIGEGTIFKIITSGNNTQN